MHPFHPAPYDLCRHARMFGRPARCDESGACEIRFGTLPVLQALPLFVARDKGLFAKAKLKVELVPFNTASERDIALTAKTIDGTFGDLFSAAILRETGSTSR